MTEVPFVIASPSLGAKRICDKPSCSSADRASISSSLKSTLKQVSEPMSAPVIAASGIRSPLAPIEPSSCTCGVTPALRKTSIRRIRSSRTPEIPCISEFARKSMPARTSSFGSLLPAPVLRNQTILFCSSVVSSFEIKTSAIPPKPVVTP